MSRPQNRSYSVALSSFAGRKPIVFNIKGDPDWGSWVERAAAHSRMSVSAYIDFALAKTAKAEGFAEKPPQRLP